MVSSRRALRELGYYDPPRRWPRLRLAFFSAMFGTILGAAGVIALGTVPDLNFGQESKEAAPSAKTAKPVSAKATTDETEGSNASVPVTTHNAVPTDDPPKPAAKLDDGATVGTAPAPTGVTPQVPSTTPAPEPSTASAPQVPENASSEAAPHHAAAAQPSGQTRKRPRKIARTREGDDSSSPREERTDQWSGRGYTGYVAQDRRRSDAGNEGWRDQRTSRWDGRGWDGRGYASYAGQQRRRGEADNDSPARDERAGRGDARSGQAQERRRGEVGDDSSWRDRRPRSGRSRASAGDDNEGRGGFGRDAADAREGSRGTRGLWFW